MVRCHKNSSLCSRLFLVGVNRHVISALLNFQKSKMAATARPATRRKIGFKSLVTAMTSSLTRVKGAAKCITYFLTPLTLVNAKSNT